MAPPSKSAMQRACAAALLHKGTCLIRNAGSSSDEQAALRVIEQLGAAVEKKAEGWWISSAGILPKTDILDCGESGLAIRMFTPIAALSPQAIRITGSGTLANRPLDFFDTVLPQLGVLVKTTAGRVPLTIKGPLVPATIQIDGSLSSQFLTGLLMSYAGAGANGVTIHVTNLASRPYIDLTLAVMQVFGLPLPQQQDASFHFTGSTPSATDFVDYTVEGDWSGAAFLLVAGALAGKVSVHGISPHSTQGDKKILEVLMHAGAWVEQEENLITVQRRNLLPFDFDATDCPDLFPPLVALAANCSGISNIKGVGRLRYKESNRAATLQETFAKLGIRIAIENDVMQVTGTEKISIIDPVISSHSDHRIAMAIAVAALRADRAVDIHGADAVKKSYPGFWDDLQALNAGISLKPFTTDNTFRL